MRGLRRVKTLLRRLTDARGIREEAEERRVDLMVGFPGKRKAHRAFQIQLLKDRGLQRHHSFLEIGCGPLTAGLRLIEYLDQGNYYGLDIRPWSVCEAHVQVAKANLAHKNPRLLVSATFGREGIEQRQFDYLGAFSVLFHFDDATAADCFEQVSRWMKHDSTFYANVNVEQPSSQWHEFPFVQRPLAFYERLSGEFGLRMEVLGQLKDLGYALEDVARLNYVLAFQKKASQATTVQLSA